MLLASPARRCTVTLLVTALAFAGSAPLPAVPSNLGPDAGPRPPTLPVLTLERVRDPGIVSIREFWEFAPAWDASLAPGDRPLIVNLHGNMRKVRNNPRAAVTLEVYGPRLFAAFPGDFDLSEDLRPHNRVDPNSREERQLALFRLAAAAHDWRAVLVSPVLAVPGPWPPADVAAFAAEAAARHGCSRRVYLVGTSVGAFGGMRLLEHLASLRYTAALKEPKRTTAQAQTLQPLPPPAAAAPPHTPFFAAAALVSPGCGRVAGPHFLGDPYCVTPERAVAEEVIAGLGRAVAESGTPVMFYQVRPHECAACVFL